MRPLPRIFITLAVLWTILAGAGCADDGKKKGCGGEDVDMFMADHQSCIEDCAGDTACEDDCFDVLCEELNDLGCDVSGTGCDL